jgi:O-methyltransferase involved in polyketide biosynthesis
MGSAAPLEGVAATTLAVAAIRAEETARADRLFADPLAAAFVAASGWSPSRVLLAFAAEFEDGSDVALAISANLLRFSIGKACGSATCPCWPGCRSRRSA